MPSYSSTLDLFCTGAETHDGSANTINCDGFVNTVPNRFTLFSQILFSMVENVISEILRLDEFIQFKDDVLIDILSSIWFVINIALLLYLIPLSSSNNKDNIIICSIDNYEPQILFAITMHVYGLRIPAFTTDQIELGEIFQISEHSYTLYNNKFDEYLLLIVGSINKLEKPLKYDFHYNIKQYLFGGVSATQMIGRKECKHYTEKSYPPVTLNLDVEVTQDIKNSLSSYVQGQVFMIINVINVINELKY